MRLNEIIEPRVIDRTRTTPFDREYRERHSQAHQRRLAADEPGVGYYAKGRPNIQDPFMFTKISGRLRELENDAYFAYVQAIQPYMASNPYLPRVYVTKIDRDPSGRLAIPRYQMERLFDLRQIDGGDLETREAIYQELSDRILQPSPADPEIVFHLIDQAARTGDFQRIRDPMLVEALKIVRAVREQRPSQFQYDLHRGNFLFRTGTTGVQLVLADPISG